MLLIWKYSQVDNDPLQRVYGVSFPSKDRMKKFNEFQEQVRRV